MGCYNTPDIIGRDRSIIVGHEISPPHFAIGLQGIWFLGSIRVHNPNGTSIGSAVFVRLMIVTYRQTDRQTDHATRSLTIGRMYVGLYVALRCGRIILLL